MARFTLAGISSHSFDDVPSAERQGPVTPANQGGWYRLIDITNGALNEVSRHQRATDSDLE